jgi:hypothetical protein
MKRIFFTFSSKKPYKSDEVINLVLKLIDKSDKFEIAHRWFEHMSKDSNDLRIYEAGIRALFGSDLVVADVSVPSTGVGQQIALAMLHKIPVLILAKENFETEKHSFFLKGTKSTYISFFYYHDIKDISENLVSLIEEKTNDELEKLNFIATKSIKKLLDEESKKRRISQSELLRQIILDWNDKKENSTEK